MVAINVQLLGIMQCRSTDLLCVYGAAICFDSRRQHTHCSLATSARGYLAKFFFTKKLFRSFGENHIEYDRIRARAQPNAYLSSSTELVEAAA